MENTWPAYRISLITDENARYSLILYKRFILYVYFQFQQAKYFTQNRRMETHGALSAEIVSISKNCPPGHFLPPHSGLQQNVPDETID